VSADRAHFAAVVLAMNDWGGAQLPIAEHRDQRIGQLVLVVCEAFENFPPGIPGPATEWR
jgi:hypothetical protein